MGRLATSQSNYVASDLTLQSADTADQPMIRLKREQQGQRVANHHNDHDQSILSPEHEMALLCIKYFCNPSKAFGLTRRLQAGLSLNCFQLIHQTKHHGIAKLVYAQRSGTSSTCECEASLPHCSFQKTFERNCQNSSFEKSC